MLNILLKHDCFLSSAIYRSPKACLPWFISVWIVHSPLMFLVASVLAFSAGLVCFTFWNFRHYLVIPIVTAVCTSITSFGLLSVSLWVLGERSTFKKTNGKKVNPSHLGVHAKSDVALVQSKVAHRICTECHRNHSTLFRVPIRGLISPETE